MQAPEWLKPGIVGAVVGGIATVVLGFSQGGWYLGGSAERMADERSVAAVTSALAPFCVSQSKAAPSGPMKLAELEAITSTYGRRDYVMKAGWATMPATEAPNRDVATACAELLAAADKI